MPELPEVETVRLGLRPVMKGAVIAKVELRRPDLRVPFPPGFAAALAQRRVTCLRRRGKYLLADLDDGNVLVMHLGMSGSFRIEAPPEPGGAGSARPSARADQAHDHVVFHLASGARVIFNDPRRFGLMSLLPRAAVDGSPHFRAMGIEPLGVAMTGDGLARLFTGRAAPLKAVLTDQRAIAGLGNIYACEALWRARLSPFRPARQLVTASGRASAAARRLADSIRAVLSEALAAGGSSLRNHRRTSGELGTFQHAFAVYDRDGLACLRPRCRGIIRRTVQSGRSTFYCPVCQR